MRNIIWFIALLLLLLAQVGILLPLHVFPVNLILVVVAMALILSDFNQGLVITLAGGLLLDFVSGSPDGLVSMSLLVAFLVMRTVESQILSREPNRFILAVSVVGTTTLYFLAFLGLNRLFGFFNLAQNPEVGFILSVQLPLMLMWNLIFAYPIFRFYLFVQNLAAKLPHHEEPIRT